MTELTGTFFDAATGKALGTNEKTLNFDSLNITVADNEKPSIETVRELRLEYTESCGDSCKSVSFDTFMTFKELRKLIRELLGGDA